jgi:excisionase family DNA binding protein
MTIAPPLGDHTTMTLNDAAAALGVTAATLRQQIHAGRLNASKMGPIWTVTEEDLGRYRIDHHGRPGRPFVGRRGYVDTQHVRLRLLFAPADGRGHDSLWLQYLRESIVLDLDWANPKPFRWDGEPFEVLDRKRPIAGGRIVELWNRANVARELGTRPEIVDLLDRQDATFPKPVTTFRDGSVWDGGAVERWQAQRDGRAPALRRILL